MKLEESELDTLLDSLTGGERIDWDGAESRASDDGTRKRLRALRDVARLADFHRTLQRGVGTAPVGRDLERWGPLLLLEHVGAGRAGVVFRAWDPTLQREVALKLLRGGEEGEPEGAGPLAEARALARVRDQHVVSVFGAGEHEGRSGVWMEFLRGPTLEAEITRRGPLPPEEVAALGAQLGRALAAVHAAGVLHRDVKPANVIVEPGPRAVLMDFGIGQRRGVVEGEPLALTGTPMFMSPQRLAGAAATPSDDLYALGVTLRWALTGSPPFEARSIEELWKATQAGPPRPLRAARPDAPPALVDAIDRAMEREPARRFAHATALAAAFEAAASPAVAAPPRVRHRVAWLATAAAIAAVALLMLRPWASRRPAAPTAPPVAAPAPAVDLYDVAAGFVRHGRDGAVQVQSGDRVGPGDQLSLQFRATRPTWVYVLDSDERGEIYLLFPQPLFDQRNPVPKDSDVSLPGTMGGKPSAWTVTSRGGREHLLVVASPSPVPELEAELAQLPAPVPGRPVRYARIGAGTVERLRGVGGVSEIPPTPSRRGPAALFERIQSLAGREQGVRGTWVRQVILENPLR